MHWSASVEQIVCFKKLGPFGRLVCMYDAADDDDDLVVVLQGLFNWFPSRTQWLTFFLPIGASSSILGSMEFVKGLRTALIQR